MAFLSSFVVLAALQVVSPARVDVAPGAFVLSVDSAVLLTAHAYDANGNLLPGISIRWLTQDGELATVEEGRVVALRPGQVRILAVAGDQSGFATVTIPELPATEIDLSVPTGTMAVGTSVPTYITLTTRIGTQLDSRGVRYEALSSNIATVDATGRIHAHGEGRAQIRASMDGISEIVAIQVVANTADDYRLTPETNEVRTGDVIRFKVETVSSGGSSLDIYPAWSVSGSGVQMDADGAEGVFVAEEPGRYQVTAVIGEAMVRSTIVDVAERTYAAQLTSVGRGAAATHHSGDVWVFEGVDGRDYAYIGTFGHDWMKVWDVTDPSQPILTDSMQLDARRINDVKIHPNNRVGILTREGASNRRNGMVILDLSIPAKPTIASEYTETVTGGVHNVWIEPNDIVYAAHNGTSDMHIIDISDPRNPTEVGRWGLSKEANRKTLHDIIVQGGYAYLSYWDDGIIMLDVGAGTHGGTSTNPAFVSQYKYPIGNSHVAWRSGRYLFIGDELFPPNWDADLPIEARGYIHVVDYDDPEQPHEVARYEVPEAGAHNMWVDGERLYVGYYQAGLRVVDISGELRGDLYRQGREVAAIKTTDANTTVPNWPMTWGAQIFKGHIFTSDLNSGLWVVRLDETVLVP